MLKEGSYEDSERRDQLLELSRFTTTVDGGVRWLKQYAADLKPNQTEIYYLVGESAQPEISQPRRGPILRFVGGITDTAARLIHR